MQLRVKGPRGIITLEVELIENIIEIKYKIEDKTGYPIDKQIVLYQGVILEDHKCLQDYRINNESQLELQLKLKLTIKTAFQYQFSVECRPTAQIYDLKVEISRTVHIEPRHQILSFENKVVTNEQIICECRMVENSVLLLSGINKVTVNLPSGKIFECPMAHKTSVLGIKTKINDQEHIPIDQQQFNYKGRELQNQQTLESIHYTNTDCINLVINFTSKDDIFIIVKNTNNRRHLVQVNRLNPVGRIVDSTRVKSTDQTPLCLFFNGNRLPDENVLNCYDKIELLSELILMPTCDNSVPMVVNTIGGDFETLYLNSEEDIPQVIVKIRNHFRLPDGNFKLFYKHRILDSEGFVNSCDFIPGDNLFLGPEESRKVTILSSSSRPFDILASHNDEVLALKRRIFRKERIPVESQELSCMGEVLDDSKLFGDFATDHDLNLNLNILPSELLKVKVRDLEGNWFNTKNVDKCWSVSRLASNLKRLIPPIGDDDLLVCAGVVMDRDRLLCNYDVINSPEVWVVSINTGIVSQYVPNVTHITRSVPASHPYARQPDEQLDPTQHSIGPFAQPGYDSRFAPDNRSRPQMFHSQSEESSSMRSTDEDFPYQRNIGPQNIFNPQDHKFHSVHPPTYQNFPQNAPIFGHVDVTQSVGKFRYDTPHAFQQPQPQHYFPQQGYPQEYQHRQNIPFQRTHFYQQTPSQHPYYQPSGQQQYAHQQPTQQYQNEPAQANMAYQQIPSGQQQHMDTGAIPQYQQHSYGQEQTQVEPLHQKMTSPIHQQPQTYEQSPLRGQFTQHVYDYGTQYEQAQQMTPQNPPFSPDKPESGFPTSAQQNPQDLIKLTAGFQNLGVSETPTQTSDKTVQSPPYAAQGNSSQVVSSNPYSGLPQSPSSTCEHNDLTLNILHPSGFPVEVKCKDSYTIRQMKEQFSPLSDIPVSKMKLSCDGEHLLNEEMTIMHYKMHYKSDIELTDILPVNVVSKQDSTLKWMNGSECVSDLATEIEHQFSISKESFVLKCNNELMVSEKKLSSYNLTHSSEVKIEFLF